MCVCVCSYQSDCSCGKASGRKRRWLCWSASSFVKQPLGGHLSWWLVHPERAEEMETNELTLFVRNGWNWLDPPIPSAGSCWFGRDSWRGCLFSINWLMKSKESSLNPQFVFIGIFKHHLRILENLSKNPGTRLDPWIHVEWSDPDVGQSDPDESIASVGWAFSGLVESWRRITVSMPRTTIELKANSQFGCGGSRRIDINEWFSGGRNDFICPFHGWIGEKDTFLNDIVCPIDAPSVPGFQQRRDPSVRACCRILWIIEDHGHRGRLLNDPAGSKYP